MEDNLQIETIEGWAYLEIMGHSKVAGRISTKKLGVSVMFQIDIPKGETDFSHTEFYSPAAIFSIKPTTEEWCRKFSTAREQYNYEVLPYIPGQKQLGEHDNSFFDPADDDHDPEENYDPHCDE